MSDYVDRILAWVDSIDDHVETLSESLMYDVFSKEDLGKILLARDAQIMRLRKTVKEQDKTLAEYRTFERRALLRDEQVIKDQESFEQLIVVKNEEIKRLKGVL